MSLIKNIPEATQQGTLSKLSNNIIHFRETDLNAVISKILEDLEITISV
jgi:hypothetical protein